jgi:hypothetical protein
MCPRSSFLHPLGATLSAIPHAAFGSTVCRDLARNGSHVKRRARNVPQMSATPLALPALIRLQLPLERMVLENAGRRVVADVVESSVRHRALKVVALVHTVAHAECVALARPGVRPRKAVPCITAGAGVLSNDSSVGARSNSITGV